eukprot:4843920-Amphidinium_carterae.1
MVSCSVGDHECPVFTSRRVHEAIKSSVVEWRHRLHLVYGLKVPCTYRSQNLWRDLRCADSLRLMDGAADNREKLKETLFQSRLWQDFCSVELRTRNELTSNVLLSKVHLMPDSTETPHEAAIVQSCPVNMGRYGKSGLTQEHASRLCGEVAEVASQAESSTPITRCFTLLSFLDGKTLMMLHEVFLHDLPETTQCTPSHAGLQYLYGGARANTGIARGRYMVEVQQPAPRQYFAPKRALRIAAKLGALKMSSILCFRSVQHDAP